MRDWNKTTALLPEKDKSIEWMDSNGHITRGKYLGGVVWLMNNGMYIYYVPTFWRYV